ncbi:phosphate ABC transporter, permease protein PstA [Synechococcus sp. PCC 7502]|uniref:phosphate ABC transporter permease PstA n=1 Tax=Synechococcus sp. PCC 7502 TaxID=1173263 RepID=UPI00029FA330|nr:phosphate ABC transporter permease PstA [Synechococcus sp. PCC 7502]AFY72196.1 phosphate ABC transporter, permease protein PstA [Synechococcus sp. PCC 7502]
MSNQVQESELIELTVPLPVIRSNFNLFMTVLAFALTGVALIPLGSILIEIFFKGLPYLSFDVFTSLPAAVGEQDVKNGFANAILGTLLMVGVASLAAIPFGVMAGIYLSEFGKEQPKTAGYVRFATRILSSVPSIVVGVFAYGVIVANFKSFSALAGSFALATIMLPIVTLTSEEALKLIPTSVRQASAALGGNRFQTTFRIVVSAALPGITTGVLLAVARVAGETAPLLFTALSSQDWPQGLFNPAPSLAVLIYQYSTSAYPEQNKLAWTAAAVLLILVITVNVVSRLVTRDRLNTR